MSHTPEGGVVCSACGHINGAHYHCRIAELERERDALLAACELALKGFEAFEESARGNSDLWMPTVLAFDTIRAAIAKARGVDGALNVVPTTELKRLRDLCMEHGCGHVLMIFDGSS